MSLRVTATLAILAGALCVAIAGQPTKSQWTGIYTEAQAKRGEPLYADMCAACHGKDLKGTELAPALAGADFRATWNELRLGDLFERIRLTMPQNDPGTLTREQNADVLAYMLRESGYPAGDAALPSDTATLNTYTFLAEKPDAR
jgi:mono/diheme cytochrome c family protein